jgi:hypothetical protein
LINAPTLVLPNPHKPYRVVTDASDIGVGAVLLQDDKPVAYFSKKLNSAESRYTTTEKELLGVLYALKEWRCYLLGTSFVVLLTIRLIASYKPNPYFHPEGRVGRISAKFRYTLGMVTWGWQPSRPTVKMS